MGTKGAAADAEGNATVSGLAPGRYRVRVSYIGYQTREVAARLDAPGPLGLIVELADDPAALGEVVVSGRDLRDTRLEADGFFERQATGSGTVLAIEDLERRAPIRLGDVFGGILGMRVVRGDFGRVVVTRSGGSECRLSVFIDGRFDPVVSEDLDLFSANGVVAVEVYRRPSQVPLQYN